jgi:hypothetical protein
VVLVPHRRRFHVLAPAAAGLWGSLDGRPLDEVVAGLTGTDEARRPDRSGDPMLACVEMLRRWRALGLVEECGGRHGGSAEPHRIPAPRATISFRASAADAGATLVVGATADQRVTVRVRPPQVVGAGVPLTGVREVIQTPAPTMVEGPIGVLDVFGALLEGVVEDEVVDPGLADALAGLAEDLPGRRVLDS